MSGSRRTIKPSRTREHELEAVAERHGWQVVAVFKDQGISGAKGRDARPGLDRLMQAVARKEIDMVAAWSVRSAWPIAAGSPEPVAGAARQRRRSVSCTSRGSIRRRRRDKAMFQMLGVFAEFERAMIHERVMAGLARARAEGTQLGRPGGIAGDAAKVRR